MVECLIICGIPAGIRVPGLVLRVYGSGFIHRIVGRREVFEVLFEFRFKGLKCRGESTHPTTLGLGYRV